MKYRGFLVSVVILLLLCSFAPIAAANTIQDQLNQAKTLYVQHNNDEAISILSSVLDKDPNNEEALKYTALCFTDKHDYVVANSYIDQLELINPENQDYRQLWNENLHHMALESLPYIDPKAAYNPLMVEPGTNPVIEWFTPEAKIVNGIIYETKILLILGPFSERASQGGTSQGGESIPIAQPTTKVTLKSDITAMCNVKGKWNNPFRGEAWKWGEANSVARYGFDVELVILNQYHDRNANYDTIDGTMTWTFVTCPWPGGMNGDICKQFSQTPVSGSVTGKVSGATIEIDTGGSLWTGSCTAGSLVGTVAQKNTEEGQPAWAGTFVLYPEH